jgi:hypothetical protein
MRLEVSLGKGGLGKISARKIVIGATFISRLSPPPPAASQVCSTLPRPSANGNDGQVRRKSQRVLQPARTLSRRRRHCHLVDPDPCVACRFSPGSLFRIDLVFTRASAAIASGSRPKVHRLVCDSVRHATTPPTGSTNACRDCRSGVRWAGRCDRVAPPGLERHGA